LAWVISVSVLAFGPKWIWGKDVRSITLAAAALNVLVGIKIIIIYNDSIKDYDELQKQITLEAMAIALGAVFVVGIPYQLISQYNIVPFEAELSHIYFVIALTFLASLYFLHRRYR
jgi:hypothetical protein